MLKFDEANLESVAKIVLMTNPHAADRWENVDELVYNMRTTAYGGFTEDLGFVSTAGYMLTYYKSGEDEVSVRASLTDYNLLKFFEKSMLTSTKG